MDKSHFNTFIFSNANKIYYYVFCILKDHKQSLQIVSQTIEECWDKRSEIAPTDLHKVFQLARKLAKSNASYSNVSQHSTQSDQYLQNVNPVLKKFCLLIKDYAPLQAEVICLRSLARLSVDEIALILEVGINNVISILANARKMMRSAIDPVGVLNDFSCHELLPKYYSGNTSIDEEEQLRLFVSRMDLTEIPDADREILLMFLKLGNAEIPVEDSEMLTSKLKELQTGKIKKAFSKFRKQSK
ncbi:RNA polymerase sigma factor [Marinifilum caeruleilacunae]|uniref:Sigma-70 family RNA polymerase sigma factor n=1 Tax=Marinifilum caeruleilacunae TaxID=2499076 RepID=A0ABX1WZP7_9BACT|nr:sigma-70 family RNA polymerase sigma factor [Marinifilum caeruleilacunae]NOU61431.1 sigma-70 family RNA polymerase sigma factor [Marinifilum caeruleilacunae]